MNDEIIEKITEKIDFRSGTVQKITPEQFEICYKLNVHLVFYFHKSAKNVWHYVTRNGEQVSCTYINHKFDDAFFKSVQHLINEIENGDFNYKKTESEKIAEIIQKRRLVSYMNNTKWTEFVHAMSKEMSIAIPYDYKTLFDDYDNELFDIFYDRESFNNYNFKAIEWVKVKPKFYESIHKGMLIPDEKIFYDVSQEFISLMKKYSIPYEYDEVNEVYIIYGYK